MMDSFLVVAESTAIPNCYLTKNEMSLLCISLSAYLVAERENKNVWEYTSFSKERMSLNRTSNRAKNSCCCHF